MARAVGFVLIYFSAAWLPCVSAGGRYCQRTAAARAAALGLKFPGDHGAPDLSGPPPYSALHPRPHHHRRFQNKPPPPATDYHPSNEFPHFQPAGYGGPFQPDPLSGLFGGEPLSHRRAGFAQVKRVGGPLMQNQPPGQVEFVDGTSESQRSGLQRVSNGMGGLSGRGQPSVPRYGFYYRPYPAESRPGVVEPNVGTGEGWRGHFPRNMYGRMKNKPRNPFYLGKNPLLFE